MDKGKKNVFCVCSSLTNKKPYFLLFFDLISKHVLHFVPYVFTFFVCMPCYGYTLAKFRLRRDRLHHKCNEWRNKKLFFTCLCNNLLKNVLTIRSYVRWCKSRGWPSFVFNVKCFSCDKCLRFGENDSIDTPCVKNVVLCAS